MNSRQPAPRPVSTAGVRRNLFNQHLSRRPPMTGPPNHSIASSSSGSNQVAGITLPSSIGSTASQHMGSDAMTSSAVATDSSSDIVVRDRNGNYQVQMPLVMFSGEGELGQGEGGLGSGGDEIGSEKAKIGARLVELYRSHNRRASEPAELFAAVQASLRAKAASLDEDDWMFESEKDGFSNI
ncbi:hypothetical protein L228DRAFT_249105 [Xylona heveae TC161]|uniref:Uncharacterized protein n=1 Tax=Xylona heveae (strain CBS 132557 / TC161) TaxID=1328760 RepID=A0A165FRV3_XYLHT|nr:hypothetical protein L228DRAFT_249105 [Xylona heveae TC161]KZF21300.1 hypothetical protein L228DRAFT_249105 [Xylona heveae TC161]